MNQANRFNYLDLNSEIIRVGRWEMLHGVHKYDTENSYLTKKYMNFKIGLVACTMYICILDCVHIQSPLIRTSQTQQKVSKEVY